MYRFKSISKQPLVKLTLAIAAGYVLAHFAVKLLDAVYEGAERNPDAAVIFVCTVVGAAFIAWYLRGKISSPNLSRVWLWFWRNNFYIAMGCVFVAAVASSRIIMYMFLWAVIAGAFRLIYNWLSPA